MATAVSGSPAGIALAGGTSGEECRDWTVLRAPGATASGTVDAAEGQGAQPARFAVDAALSAAAESLNYTTSAAHIVLVATGGPQCISVACSLSRTLAADGMDFRVDVLGLDPAADRLRCIADNTGGTFRSVDGRNLQRALSELMAAAEMPEAGDGEAAPESAAAAVEHEAPSSGEAPLAQDGEAIAADSGEAENGLSPAAQIPIPPPRRQPAAAPPAMTTETDTGTESGSSVGLKTLSWALAEPRPVPEEASTPASDETATLGVRLKAVAAEGAAPLSSELTFEVLAVEGDGAYRLVGRSWAPEPVFQLPPGEYVARITHGGVVREHKFRANGDGVEQRTITLDLGYVSLAAVATADTPHLESDLRYTLQRVGGGAPIVRYAPQPMLTLPAGTYKVTVESGAARSSTMLDVAAGETVSKVFNLRLGYLRLRPDSVGAESTSVSIEADSSEGSGDPTPPLAEARSEHGESLLLRLPAGRHVAVAERDGRVVVRQVVTVAPGRLTQVTLKPQTVQSDWEFGQF